MNQRPLTADELEKLSEYLWQFTLFNNSDYAVESSTRSATGSTLTQTIRIGQLVRGVSGGCDHTHAGSARLFSRVALATTGCVPFLQKRTPTLEQLLTHELAHVFGAFHPAPGVRLLQGVAVS